MPDLKVLEGGATNSRPTPETWNRHGIDTVRYRYRTDTHAYEKFARAGASNEGVRGELYRQEDGVRIGAHRDGMLYAEGRLAAILNGPDDHSLLPMAALEDGADAAAQRFGARFSAIDDKATSGFEPLFASSLHLQGFPSRFRRLAKRAAGRQCISASSSSGQVRAARTPWRFQMALPGPP